MSTLRTARRAVLGVAAPLFLAGGLASAQDGRTDLGPPVTSPPTNKNRETPNTFVPPRVGSEVLTPVPATATDPAPPGTRVERVDIPGANRDRGRPPAGSVRPDAATGPAGAAAVPGAGAEVPGTSLAAALPAGVVAAEGVIVGKIQRPGKDMPDEVIRLSIDPTRNWAAYSGPGATDSLAPAGEAKADDRKPLDLVLTRHSVSHLYTFARSPDGAVVRDPYNPNAPDYGRSRTGTTPTDSAPAPAIAPTNFTVLKPGQFVAVQYRKTGKLNQVTAMSVIVPQTPTPATGTNSPAIVRPNAAGTGLGAGPGGTGPAAGGTRTEKAGRVPRVPNNPVIVPDNL